MEKPLKEKLTGYADSINVGLFGSRKTTQQAYDYAEMIIESLPANSRLSARTMLHVMMNTISNNIKEMCNEVTD